MIETKFKEFTDDTLLALIDDKGISLNFLAGDVIVQPDKYIRVIPLVLKGTVRVLRVDENGNELFLYYVNEGESCAMSLSTSLSDKVSDIKAVAEEDTELIAIPADLAHKWFDQFSDWRRFVLNTINLRFDDLLKTVDTIAFSKMDDRLILFLSQKSKAIKSNTIQITHQDIATELSTSREVISRLLKHLEKEGKVALSRSKIEIIAPM